MNRTEIRSQIIFYIDKGLSRRSHKSYNLFLDFKTEYPEVPEAEVESVLEELIANGEIVQGDHNCGKDTLIVVAFMPRTAATIVNENRKKDQTGPLKFYKLKDPGGFMSNFYRSELFIYGRTWATVEHAYQAQKCVDDKEYNEIHEAKTPMDARIVGQQIKMREDWDSVKYSVMEACVWAKFTQDHTLKQQLLDTGDRELIEDSPVDWYWGCGDDGKGQNMLGQILMKTREKLRP